MFIIIKSFVRYYIKKKPVYNLRRNLIIPIFILLILSSIANVTFFFHNVFDVKRSRHVFQKLCNNFMIEQY